MLNINNISKRMDSFLLSNVSLTVEPGDYVVLLGRSGSGKTQLLELLSGLSYPDKGSITLDGNDITRIIPQQRDIGMVFQDFALFPHMTTFDNIAYPLRIQKRPKKEIITRVHAMAGKMNISMILNRKTISLSGGEQQRTALARTLITTPRLLLLDEPLASVDASLKDDITRLLRTVNRSGQTIIHVTHDYSEAIGLASKVGVIHNGRIIQTGTPADVFSHPANRFVARYTGIRNFFRVQFVHSGKGWKAISVSGLELRLSGTNYPEKGLLVIRSQNVKLKADADEYIDTNVIKGEVKEMVAIPTGMEIEVDAGGELIFVSLNENDPLINELTTGAAVNVIMNPDDIICLRGSEQTDT